MPTPTICGRDRRLDELSIRQVEFLARAGRYVETMGRGIQEQTERGERLRCGSSFRSDAVGAEIATFNVTASPAPPRLLDGLPTARPTRLLQESSASTPHFNR